MRSLPQVILSFCIHISILMGSVTTLSIVFAAEKQWWPSKVNVFNPACTGGNAACWLDSRNKADKLELVDYIPLTAELVKNKHHICASFPHLKDSYWSGVAYGIVSEGKRLGQKITLVEAGGYTNLEWQINQIENCIANGAEALIIGPISNIGNIRQVDMLRTKGIPIVVIVTDIGTTVDAKSLQSFYNMGYTSCKWVADHSSIQNSKSGKIKIAWFPGPQGAGWSVASNEGCRSGILGTNVEIIETKWGDTGKAIQLKLVEEVLQVMVSGNDVELDYIVGTAATIEGAVGAIRERNLEDKVKLVATYYTPGMQIFLGRGLVAMAPSDQMITQARIAVDQTVRLLEHKKMATGGRPEFISKHHLAEHVQPPIIIVTPDTLKDFDTSTTLPPKSWRPIFSVD